jgi:hypothetical protein
MKVSARETRDPENVHPDSGLTEGAGAKRLRLLASLLPVLLVGLVALSLLSASRAAAQGCAMCYQNASAAGAQGSTALRHGILILLVPALTVFAGIFAFIYRRRHVAR